MKNTIAMYYKHVVKEKKNKDFCFQTLYFLTVCSVIQMKLKVEDLKVYNKSNLLECKH